MSPYLVVAMPMIAFIGVVGAIYWFLRGRRDRALALLAVGVAAVVYVVATYYASV